MNNKVFSLATLFASTLLFTSFININSNEASKLKERGLAVAAKVKWYTWEEAVEASANEKRKIFVDVYTDWCGWCKRMDKATFNDPSISKYLNDDFYAVKLNAEQRADINFKGHVFKFVSSGRRGYHQLAYELLNGRMSYPTVVVLNENFERILISPGFQKPKDFEYVLKFAAEDHYKKTTWQNFLAENKE